MSSIIIMMIGYEDESENTWEPVDNLDCDDKIQEFEKKHKVSPVQ